MIHAQSVEFVGGQFVVGKNASFAGQGLGKVQSICIDHSAYEGLHMYRLLLTTATGTFEVCFTDSFAWRPQ